MAKEEGLQPAMRDLWQAAAVQRDVHNGVDVAAKGARVTIYPLQALHLNC